MIGANRPDGVIERRFALLSIVVLGLALINLFGRLGAETVTEWDESLYATSAAEMLRSNQWAATTFNGSLDYSNSKPPLNVWLIAISFKLFGINLWALRLVSATAGLATIALLMCWLRRAYSAALALSAGLILTTCFGFFYVHSARTGNPDALFSLLALAIVVTLFFASETPHLVLWIAPMLAAAFLLKGPGAILHALVAIVCIVIWLRRVITWRLIVAVVAIAAIPIGAWAYARWRVDGSTFLRLMVTQDFLDISLEPLDNHPGSPLFYLDVLQRYQYDWIFAALAAFVLYLPRRTQSVFWLRPGGWAPPSPLVAGATATLLLVPTLMQTKVTWYGNPLLPFFSIAIGAIVLRSLRMSVSGVRQFALISIIAAAIVTAESRLIWHSYHRRDLATSDQGLLLEHRHELTGHRVFRTNWTRADAFVADYLIGCRHVKAADYNEFLDRSQAGDLWLQRRSDKTIAADPFDSNRRFVLYRR